MFPMNVGIGDGGDESRDDSRSSLHDDDGDSDSDRYCLDQRWKL